ncbi:LytTR family DNA-binding domain-containing protein [Cohaesibacter sp. CAU 1516]|uniref:LytR/AlgR family response regulator transcription factor n=1 Tax=Cohaesibacter sp. CAU 1516 TaxID=2576038 RepID=UPI001AEE9C49|nr:LytTR family DNA-binding domain-containing protein [Cohaesibacter sp. CAU 1516]
MPSKTMPIRCLIVDDEAPARDELGYLLSCYPDLTIIGEAASASKAVSLCLERQPDLVFLDIQMPGQNGFEVIRALQMADCPLPLFVFVTAYDSYAVKAFEASAVDYILKPVSEERLAHTIERARAFLGQQINPLQKQLESLLTKIQGSDHTPLPTTHRISVEKHGRIRLIDPRDIVFCSYDDSRVMAHTRDDIFPAYGIASMDRMEEHLAGSTFFRAHRSSLVNLEAVVEFSPWFNGKYSLVMGDKARSKLTVSRSRVKEFKQRLGL